MNAIVSNPPMKSFDELKAEIGVASEPIVFSDDPDWLQEHYTMIHGTDCVFDGHAGRMMKSTHLRLSAPMAFKIWQSNPSRKIVDVDYVIFDPTMRTGAGSINLFSGIKMKPAQGDCTPIKNLLLTLCNDDEALARWITCWIAYPLQHVGAKMQTSIIMRGWKNGTGKNLFWEDVVAEIYGLYGQTIDQQDVESSYNGWASCKLLIIADEVVSPGEKWHIKGALKRMITGKTVRISEKYLPTRTERNHCNFVFLSNENVPVPVDIDDRRHTIIEPITHHPPEYYAKVGQCIENGGIEAFYDYLLTVDLSGFNEHTKPFENEDRRDLIEMSMRSHERFVKNWIDGQAPVEFGPVYGEALYIAFQIWCKRNGERCTNANTLGREVQKTVQAIRKTHPGLHKKFKIYLPDGMDALMNWSNLDEFYSQIQQLAALESKTRL